MDVRRFLAELKGRGVYRVAALYSAGAWALLQVADVFFPILGLSDGAITALLALAAMGFPVALVLAWWLDLTPDGIVEATPVVVSDLESRSLSIGRLTELFLIVALMVLVAFLYLERLDTQAGDDSAAGTDPGMVGPRRPSIAVLPFVNMSDMPEIEYFGDGLAEEILNLLAKLNELDVAARTSSFYFKNREADIQEIGKHLGVRHVLEGSVRFRGEQVRVTAQLIDASNGFHLWSETYDRDFKDAFYIQDDISRKVVENLKILLSDSSRQVLDRQTTLDPAAYDYYLQGRDYLRRHAEASNIDSAIKLFSKATELNPGYAEAYAGLCDAHLGKYTLSIDKIDFDSAERACQQALALDGGSVSVYVALGNLYRESGQYGLATREFNKALSLSPTSAEAIIGLAATYALDNKPQLAEEAYRRAIGQQPNYWRGYASLGRFLFNAGRISEAIPYFQRIAELMPDDNQALNNLGAAYYLTGDFEQAAHNWQQSLALAPSAAAYANTGSSLFFLGRFDEAADMYQKYVEMAPEDFEAWGNLGDAYRFSETLHEYSEPMYRNAIKLAAARLEVNPSDASTLSLVAHYYANVSERELALQYLAKATALAPQDMYVNYAAAITYAALDEAGQALDALEKALELGYSKELVSLDAQLRNLRQLPRFQALTVQDE